MPKEKLSIAADKLNEIDLSELLKNIPDGDEFKFYFNLLAGKEHYRLLSYISTLYNNENIFDIGTYKGFSSIALGYNPTNKIVSYDILEDGDLWYIKHSNLSDNIEFILGDCVLDHRLLNSNFI